jgi:tetratricopeptide (TPR) repeat protein
MRPNLEIIDAYLEGELSDTEKSEVDMQIAENKDFAKEFTFIILAKKAAKEAADAERKKDFEALKSGLELQKNNNIFTKRYSKIWAAAASILVIMGLFLIFDTKPNAEKLANNYIKTQITELPVMMGADDDSLQLAIQFYNKKEYTNAQIIFEKLAVKNPKALEYLGLSALQLEQYDKAVQVFEQLSVNKTYKSRAKLLIALSLIKKGDKARCYQIIKEIELKDLSLEDREFIEDMAIRN